MSQESHSELKPQGATEKWYLRWWMVVVWLLTLGPFGFPLLWKSKDISRFWKWFWTIAVSVLTLFLSWSTWTLIKTLINQLKEAGLSF